ncbi:hypothetical protein OSJ57_27010, partial [Sphingomonas sp. HH69]
PRANQETCAQHLENPPGQGINQRQNQTGGLERCIPSLNAWSYRVVAVAATLSDDIARTRSNIG